MRLVTLMNGAEMLPDPIDLKKPSDKGFFQYRDLSPKVRFAWDENEVADTQRLLGLTDAEADVLPRLGRGVALWKVRQQTFIVDHRLGDREWGIIDTDHSMRASAEGFAQEARV